MSHRPAIARLSAAPEDRPLTAALVSGAALAPENWPDAPAVYRILRQTAAQDLSAGRLLEGHINAHRLVRAFGSPAQIEAAETAMRRGELFGVWGADGAVPVRWDGRQLSGAKRFASGVGLVRHALITAASEMGQQLVLARVTEAPRQHPEDWRMAGMADSLSGGFDCAALAGAPLGAADVYQTEPHFIGGTWRIAAVTLGGITGLLERTRAQLNARGFLDADAQLLRLAPLAIRLLAAHAAVLRAGEGVEGAAGRQHPARAAALSIATRLLTEELGQDSIAAVERSIGLSMFALEDPVGRMARDLACYMRQAARDAFTLKLGRDLLGGDTPLEDWFDA